jgi:hypothetical protein
MKITKEELRNIISEAVASSPNRQFSIHELKRINKKAYDGYVEMLIEDCADSFSVGKDGKITAYVVNSEGATKDIVTFDPSNKNPSTEIGGGWEVAPAVQKRSRVR